jgi:DNA invertase Pin-like site-specific DNA recombinase
MRFGYARVSRVEQNLELQLDALSSSGCTKIFTDKASGGKDDRKGLLEALSFARPGDTIVVWRLDRLSRSLRHLISTVYDLQAKGINLKSLNEEIDTSTPGGKLIFHVFSSLAEFERDLIRSRTKAGLEAARARGRVGGRPKSLSDKQLKLLLGMSKDKEVNVAEICRTVGISRSTYYRAIKDCEPLS